jgi:hypothetical protein
MDDTLRKMMQSDFARLRPKQALSLWRTRGIKNGTGNGQKAETRSKTAAGVAETDEAV